MCPTLFEQNVQSIKTIDSEGNRIKIFFEDYLVEKSFENVIEADTKASKKTQEHCQLQ